MKRPVAYLLTALSLLIIDIPSTRAWSRSLCRHSVKTVETDSVLNTSTLCDELDLLSSGVGAAFDGDQLVLRMSDRELVPNVGLCLGSRFCRSSDGILASDAYKCTPESEQLANQCYCVVSSCLNEMRACSLPWLFSTSRVGAEINSESSNSLRLASTSDHILMLRDNRPECNYYPSFQDEDDETHCFGVAPAIFHYTGPLIHYGFSSSVDKNVDIVPESENGNNYRVDSRSGWHYKIGWCIQFVTNDIYRSNPSDYTISLYYEQQRLNSIVRRSENVLTTRSLDSTQTIATLSYTSEVATARLALSYRHNIRYSKYGVEFGLAPGVVLNCNRLELATIDTSFVWQDPLSKHTLPIDTEGHTLFVRDQSQPSNRVVLGLHFAIQYQYLNVSRSISVTPNVYVDYDILPAFSYTKNYSFGIGIRFSFRPDRLL